MAKSKKSVKESLEPITVVKTYESFLRSSYKKLDEGGLDDVYAAMASVGAESEESPKVKAKVKTSNVEAAKALSKESPKIEAKVEVKVEDANVLMDKAIKYAEKKIKLESAKKYLSRIKGVKITEDFDSEKNYTYYPGGYKEGIKNDERNAPTIKGQKEGGNPFATCLGMKFFKNGICIVTYSGELGFYDAETGYYSIYTGKKTYWRESIKDLIANKGVPRKYRYLTKELVSIFSYFTKDDTITKFFKNAYNFNKFTVEAIFKASKYLMDKKDVDVLLELRELSKKNKEAKKFYDKNKELIKKLV